MKLFKNQSTLHNSVEDLKPPMNKIKDYLHDSGKEKKLLFGDQSKAGVATKPTMSNTINHSGLRRNFNLRKDYHFNQNSSLMNSCMKMDTSAPQENQRLHGQRQRSNMREKAYMSPLRQKQIESVVNIKPNQQSPDVLDEAL